MTFKLPFKLFLASVLFSQCLTTVRSSDNKLITPAINDYIKTAIHQWNLTGLAIAIVRKDPNSKTGWHQEFESYGIARADGTLVTSDTLFAWASNSKLFTALATGLLFSNETLRKERDPALSWYTKAKDAFGGLWGLWDEEASNGVTIQDMLSHRTGLPRHDGSEIPRQGGLADTVC
jgi:CubicO group peptidase (beta-lactamase class C family)